jgi:ribosomal protein L44E
MPQDMHEGETEVGHATPLKAVRRYCLRCCNDSAHEVKLCSATRCPLWPFRHGRRPDAEDRATVAGRRPYPQERDLAGTTALWAIRRRCIDCSGNSVEEVRSCVFGPDHQAPCSLHPFRAGKNPNISHSEERRQASAERLALARAARLPENPSGRPDPGERNVPGRVVAGSGSPEPDRHAQQPCRRSVTCLHEVDG